MTDRRPLLAIALILMIAIVPGFLGIRSRTAPVIADSTAVNNSPVAATPLATDSGIAIADSVVPDTTATTTDTVAALPAIPEDTVVVRSALYRYAISTRGGGIVSSRLLHYRSMHAGDTTSAGERDTLELLPPDSRMLASELRIGERSVRLDRATFVASSDSVQVGSEAASVTLTGEADGVGVALTYTFVPDDYRIRVDARFTGIGTNGATMYVGLGRGFRDTEAKPVENNREKGVVTKLTDTDLTRFSSLDRASTRTIAGPFEWVAVKSKYFVAGLFAYDSTASGVTGNIGGVIAQVLDTLKDPVHVAVTTSVTVPASGATGWTLYLGPMEYDRLSAMGRDFDDVNPYGWPVLRTVIRPFAVAIRGVFVWMHQTLNVGYGLVIVLFGILVRILLWPLNQKAMRSMTAMQAIQPEIKAMQERYKEEPQKQQQEMFKLYKTHNVNPFGGCWPMLLPYPLLVAVFFVLANTIELRGVSFLWMPDLSRGDPTYIIPVIMAVSMFGLSKIGMIGIPPNPQAKMMAYAMPVMMLVFFANFASGLNLYYAVQNLASLPQQWLIMKERKKLTTARTAPVVVNTKSGGGRRAR